MIEERKYIEKKATQWEEIPKTKYVITIGPHFKREFDNYEDALKYGEMHEASKKLREWKYVEIGEHDCNWIENGEEFKYFQELWKKSTVKTYPTTTNTKKDGYIPEGVPVKYPILLYYHYEYDGNGPDTPEFRFIDPENMIEELQKIMESRGKNE